MDYYPDQNRTIAQAYKKVIEQAEFADSLGFDSFWIAENHFTYINGICPSPSVFISSLFQKTKRINIGPSVCVLPLHHPLRVAEDYAVLDILSDGRMLMGVGTGFLEESFRGFQVSIGEKRQRFSESLEIIKKAWEGNKFSYKGTYYSVNEVQLNVTPETGSETPIWVSVTSIDGIEAMAKAGHSLLVSPLISNMSRKNLEETIQKVEQIFRFKNESNSVENVGVVFHIHIGASMDKAKSIGNDALENRINNLAKNAAFQGSLAAKRMMRIADKNYFLVFGDHGFVKDQILSLKSLGVQNFLLLMDFGGIEQDMILSSMRIFAEKVMPFI